jgi:hypothetical protein
MAIITFYSHEQKKSTFDSISAVVPTQKFVRNIMKTLQRVCRPTYILSIIKIKKMIWREAMCPLSLHYSAILD